MLCAIDVFTKYAWVKLLKDKTVKTVKKAKTALHSFIEIINESEHQPNTLWVLIQEQNFIIALRKNGN